MTEAATALGVSQSSISRRLHTLEQLLGIPLLIRDGRNVRLTAQARSLVDDVRRPLLELHRALDRAVDDGDPETGTVRFGFPLTMGAGLVPELLAGFRNRHPRVRLELKQAHGAELLDDLRSGELDLAVTIPPATDLPHRVIGTQTIVAALPQRHRLAGRTEIGLAELADDVFIANPAYYNLRQLTEKWCGTAGFEPQIVVEITEFATIRELVERGLGVALLPAADDATPGVCEVPITGALLQREIALAWPSSIFSPVVESMFDYLMRNLRRPTS